MPPKHALHEPVIKLLRAGEVLDVFPLAQLLRRPHLLLEVGGDGQPRAGGAGVAHHVDQPGGQGGGFAQAD